MSADRKCPDCENTWPEKYGANCPRCGHSFAAPYGSAAGDEKLIDDLMEAAAKLTEASDAATCAGMRVTMNVSQHLRFPGPSCAAVSVTAERVSLYDNYDPNSGRLTNKPSDVRKPETL